MEYEFRGWDGEKFIYGGVPVKNLSGGYHYVRDGMVIEHSVVSIDQWTGRLDSDGVKIYGNDIVQDDEGYISTIYYDANDSMWCATDVGGLADLPVLIKVVGHAHNREQLPQ